ncbi:DUF305 domain-containing protein [Tumidithrix helvetica PCC 7403]|uniref:DUF305 domain-containing protein n=1 Tax=Tumidithrix helvetica TaxID=3457545 RepID=UPI003CBF56D9
MPFTTEKTPIFALLLAIAPFTIGSLTACSEVKLSSPTVSSSITPSGSATTAPPKQDAAQMGHMNHGGMSMEMGTADAEYDLRFIDAMIPHHQGAIAMARTAQQKSNRPEIKKLAEAIIQDQEKEIAQLQQWRKQWYPNLSDRAMMWDSKANKMMPMTPEYKQVMMMDMDLGSANAEFDLRFMNAMIPHHEGALLMAKEAQTKTKRAEMQSLAKDILSSQQAEIDEMKQWRKTWYNQ